MKDSTLWMFWCCCVLITFHSFSRTFSLGGRSSYTFEYNLTNITITNRRKSVSGNVLYGICSHSRSEVIFYEIRLNKLDIKKRQELVI